MELIDLGVHPERIEQASNWFHKKWGIPLEAYRDSMQEALKGGAIPRWYVAMENDQIVGGLGVIENDFHDRVDLTPNVCAVYVEPEYRRRGIAGELLKHVCRECANVGIHTLYLLTDHTGFYERYGWEFFCMVQGDGEETMSRMYVHRMEV